MSKQIEPAREETTTEATPPPKSPATTELALRSKPVEVPAEPAAEAPASSEPTETPDNTAPRADEVASSAQKPAERSPAATVRSAKELIDLRKLPKLPRSKVRIDTAMQANLEVPTTVSETKKFYTDLFGQAGWKLASTGNDTKDHAQLEFTKQGFHLSASLYDGAETGMVSVHLNNLGNVDVRTLPMPEGVKANLDHFHVTRCHADASLHEMVETCAEQLTADGWQRYQRPHTAYAKNDRQRSLEFKKNGVGLTAHIIASPQGNQTIVQYSVHMLGDELPIPANAKKIEFTEAPLQLACETSDDILPTLDFFRQELTAQGWQEKGTGHQAAGEAVSVFDRTEGLPIVLKITRLGEKAPTSVSIAEFKMPREVPIEIVTNNKPFTRPSYHDPDAPVSSSVKGTLEGLLTYEDWLKKNNYQPSISRLEQYAAEMEKMTAQLNDAQPESDVSKLLPKTTFTPDEPLVDQLAASDLAIQAIEVAEGRVRTNGDELLEFVELSGREFNDEQMKLLAGMGEITYLSLSFTQVTDTGLAVVAEMPKLEKLYLSGLKISDAGLDHLKGLANLERLSLFETKITDKGLAALVGLPKLKALDLSNTAITDAAIPQLVQMRSLEELNLAGTQVSPAGIKALQAALPECEISK